jgi:hypothetical protein
MSMPPLFFVALALVSAAAALPMLAARPLPLESRFEGSQDLTASVESAEHPDLRTQMASLRGMHERLIAAGSDDDRHALLVESERVMSDGVVMMRRMKSALPVSQSGEITSEFVTEGESDAIKDFLGLMELLVQLKEDQDAIIAPSDHPDERAIVECPGLQLPERASAI